MRVHTLRGLGYCHGERFVYVSSSMVFERATEFPTTEQHVWDVPMPRSAYGFSKLAGEWPRPRYVRARSPADVRRRRPAPLAERQPALPSSPMPTPSPARAPSTERIAVFRSAVSPAAIEAAAAVLASGWLGQGDETRAFEEALAERIGARHCVAVSSGTAALHLALVALDLPPGGEIVTTPMTWIATHHAIAYAGCRPVLADIDAATGNVDPVALEARIDERTVALMAVHYAGQPCDLDELRGIARRYRLPLVEDAAHAFGATYRDSPIGAADNLQAFSFGPTKNLTTIHGGAITTADPERARRLRALRGLGVRRDTREPRRSDDGDYRVCIELDELGFRYEMSDVHAAIGRAQLHVVDAENRRRAEIARAYREGLAGVAGIALLAEREDRTSAHHMSPVLADRRGELARALRERGVNAGVHYPLNPLVDDPGDTIPRARDFARRTLTLPLHPLLDDAEVQHVIGAVRAGW